MFSGCANQLVPVGQRLGDTSLLVQGIGQAATGLGMVRLQLERRAVLGNGLVESPQSSQCQADVKVGTGPVRIDFQDLPIMQDGFFGFSKVAQSHSKVGMRVGRLGASSTAFWPTTTASSFWPSWISAMPMLL